MRRAQEEVEAETLCPSMKNSMLSSVYGALRGLALAMAVLLPAAPSALAQTSTDIAVQAREAWRLKDRKQLAALKLAAQAQQHPLTSWIDYWELNARLAEATQADLDAFYQRWPGSYVEDRLRNDWLLELGHRRDWKNLSADYARFQMRDDREVLCYALLADHLAGKKVLSEARSAWLAQRDLDEGCQLLASTLYGAKQLSSADLWLKIRLATEASRLKLAQQTASLLGKATEQAVVDTQSGTARFLSRKANTTSRAQAELTTAALIRLSTSDGPQAAELLRSRWEKKLPADLAAWAWVAVARQSAYKLQDEASDQFERAFKLAGKDWHRLEWSADTLAWAARAALRTDKGAGRPYLVLHIIERMSASEQRDPTWQFWRAKALQSTAAAGAPGDAIRSEAQSMLRGIVSPFSFYGRLAGEELGQSLTLPAAPAALQAKERATALAQPGLSRALKLIELGLRSEGVREWNFSLRTLSDRELLAAASLACEREVWDRCIHTSDRTREEIDVTQRFPTPFKAELLSQTSQIGLDAAYVYGLVRQESRFVADARSHVGASGLMQVMPATARWTAKKLGIEFNAASLGDRDVNLRIGTRYLKLVLDDFGGSMAMAAAAYNAGPGRPRRWREGATLDAAIWAETIPFHETRDYVKKVLTNTAIYAQLLGSANTSLRKRLGVSIGPRDGNTIDNSLELP